MKLDHIIAKRKNKTVYRDSDACLKVFDESYSKADILNEALNQARVEETGLEIPKIRSIAMVDGKWTIVTDYIKGKTLAQLMEENPDKRDAYLEQFVSLQLNVHAQKCPMLSMLKEKMNRKISMTKFDATTRYELHTRLDAMHGHAKLCHGDFNPSNIIISDDDGKAYIIDWAHATQGNASADVARTYLMFCLAGDTDTAEKYLNLFCKMSDTAKQYVQKWMPIVAASQSVKGNEEEFAFLSRWVHVVDYE